MAEKKTKVVLEETTPQRISFEGGKPREIEAPRRKILFSGSPAGLREFTDEEVRRKARERAEEEARKQAEAEARQKAEQERIAREEKQKKTSRIDRIRKSLSLRERAKAVRIARQEAGRVAEQKTTQALSIAKRNLQVGLGGQTIQKAFPSSPTAQRVGRGVSFAERVGGELFPGTTGQLALITGGSAGLVLLPPAVGVGVGAGLGVIGGKTALDPTLTAEERVAGGVVGVAGSTGAILGATPFIRGGIAGIRGAVRPKVSVTPKETSVPKPIGPKLFGRTRKEIPIGESKVGLVERGKGFGFSQAEQKQLVGKEVIFTTAQRGLVGRGKTEVKVLAGEEGMGLFGTPTPRELGGGLRTSRLGLSENFFKFPSPSAKLGLGMGGRPQALIQPKLKQTNIGFRGSGELETTIPAGTTLKVEPRGQAVVKGQAVDLFEITGTKGGGTPTTTTKRGTSGTSEIVRPTAPITGSIKDVDPTTRTTTSTTSPTFITPRVTTTKPSPKPPRGSSPVVPPKTPPIFPKTGGPPTISPPSLKPPRRTPPRSPPRTPIPFFPPFKLGVGERKAPRGKLRPVKKQRLTPLSVQVRRGGTFRTIATTQDLNKALFIGRERVAGTLGATFRIKGARQGIPTPFGFRRPKRTSRLTSQIPTFIEPRRKRLSRVGEKREIQRAKKKKRKKK